MPPLFINPETGPAQDIEQAKKCVLRTLTAWSCLAKHVDYLAAGDKDMDQLILYFDKRRPATIRELLAHGDPAFKQLIQPFVSALLKAKLLEINEEHGKILKGIGLPSAILGYAFVKDGMALTFASDSYWENDFIEFEGEDAGLPNIWGQTDLVAINNWLNDYYKSRSGKKNIERQFHVKFCLKDIKENSFTDNQWRLLYDTFSYAASRNFEKCPPFIKSWNNTQMLYIRDGNHTDFTTRIFFIKRGEIIYVGEVYHKTTNNTLREEAAAYRSRDAFKKLGIWDDDRVRTSNSK